MNLKASAALPFFVSLNGLRVVLGLGASTLLLSGVAQALPSVPALAAAPDIPLVPAAAASDLPPPAFLEAAPPQPVAVRDDSSQLAESEAARSIDRAIDSPQPAEVPVAEVVPATASSADVDVVAATPAVQIVSDAQAIETTADPETSLTVAAAQDQTSPNAPQPAPAAEDLAQTIAPSSKPTADAPELPTSQRASDLIGRPLIHVQGAYLLQGDESSARGRVTGLYVVNPNLLFGATVDVTGGNAFSDSRQEGLNLNELYVAVSPAGLPGLRFVAGLMDLTSYFDRNSFAKDALTHFFNPVFQTNPALAVSGIGSRPGVLANWSVNDNIELKAATFSSSRDLGDFALDAFAGEVGVRLGNAIIRGTYVSDRDAGQEDSFRESFQIPRSSSAGDDREEAYGINGEYFIPQLRLGLFGRYGWYNNSDRSANTYSLGFNFLDLFLRDDRLGLGYGRQLSNDSLRRADGNRIPDVLEAFYDVRIAPNLRAAVTFQERNEFSETIVGFRVRADFDVTGRRRRI